MTEGFFPWRLAEKRRDEMRKLKKSNEVLAEQAITDRLTGLLNRRGFLPFVEDAVRRSERQARPMAIIFLDVDNFKLFNDTYGHAVGDKVLEEMGNLLKKHVRGEDKVGRLGGEEFCVLLEEADQRGAFMWTEALRETISSLKIRTGNEALSVTVSLGIASRAPNDDFNATTLIHQADLAMNQAKAAGRNRTVLWTKSPDESQAGHQFKLDLGV